MKNIRRTLFLVCLFGSFSSLSVALTLTEMVNGPKNTAVEGKQPGPKEEVPNGLKETHVPSFSSFSKKDVEAKIQQELKEKYGENMGVKFAPWHLPGQQFTNVSQFIVEEIEVNPHRTKIAVLVHFQIKGVLKTLKIRGRLEQMIDVPTVNRPVHYGDTITKSDVSWTKIPGRQSNRFLITNPEELVGRQPRAGFLKVNMPLYQRDVKRVKDIEKGAMVAVHYQTDNLELLTKARALEDGYKGDTIRILNQETNKILHGSVVGANRISLTPDHKRDIK